MIFTYNFPLKDQKIIYYSRGDDLNGIHDHIKVLKGMEGVKETILIYDPFYGYVVGAKVKVDTKTIRDYFVGDFIAFSQNGERRPTKLPKRFNVWWAYD